MYIYKEKIKTTVYICKYNIIYPKIQVGIPTRHPEVDIYQNQNQIQHHIFMIAIQPIQHHVMQL